MSLLKISEINSFYEILRIIEFEKPKILDLILMRIK